MPSAKLLFVTGTDTEVGKTYTSLCVLKALRAHFPKILGIKLVESGLEVLAPEDEDGVRLAQASGQKDPLRALIRLKKALAAPMAADLEAVSTDNWIPFWIESIEAYLSKSNFVLIEGAGGLLSPLTWSTTMLDLMIHFRERSSVLLVSPNRLGMMSQTLATISCLRSHKINLSGLVINHPEKGDHSSDTNLLGLKKYSGLESIADLPVFRLANQQKNIEDDADFIRFVKGETS